MFFLSLYFNVVAEKCGILYLNVRYNYPLCTLYFHFSGYCNKLKTTELRLNSVAFIVQKKQGKSISIPKY